MEPERPKWKAVRTHKFFIRCFSWVIAPDAAERSREALDPASGLTRLVDSNFAPQQSAQGFRGERIRWRSFRHTVS